MKMKLLQMKKLRIAATFLLLLLTVTFMDAKRVRAADYTSAPTLSLNGAWSSDYWLTDTEKEQWYKIVIPANGKLTYKVMAYTYVCYNLYNEDLSTYVINLSNAYRNGSESSPATGVGDVVLSAGTYYFKVYKGSNGKYKLNVSFTSYNTNDNQAVSYDFPQTVSLGSAITGAITATDNEDWYRFYIPSSGYYHYQISAYGYICYNLYNEDLSTYMINLSSAYRNGSESSPATGMGDVILSAGTYYFKVYKGGSGKYTFSISALSPSNCSHSYKTTTVAPTYTSQGYTLHQCSKCGYSYKDNYKAQLVYKCSHSYQTTVTAPTFTSQGYTTHRCSKCGYSYTDNYKPKLILSTPGMRSVISGKRKATVSWYAAWYVTGYQISYRTSGSSKTVNVGKRTFSKTIKKLKSKKKYTFRVRGYRKENGKTVYSKWSAKRTVRIK